MFAPLRTVASHLPAGQWPDVRILNNVADEFGWRLVNSIGARIRFVPQLGRPARFEDTFEPRGYLRGEVMVRESNWHDLFNALVWMAFPAIKAAINQRQYESLKAQADGQRSPAGDALTMFDEDGMVVLSANTELLELIRRFRWKELFWKRRDEVRTEIRFLLFGHALYEKALRPFVGMTGKSVLLTVPPATMKLEGDALNAEVDRLVAAYIREPANLLHGKSLSPLPVLGVPGWWAPNEAAAFYEVTSYFRPGRSGGDTLESSSIS